MFQMYLNKVLIHGVGPWFINWILKRRLKRAPEPYDGVGNNYKISSTFLCKSDKVKSCNLKCLFWFFMVLLLLPWKPKKEATLFAMIVRMIIMYGIWFYCYININSTETLV